MIELVAGFHSLPLGLENGLSVIDDRFTSIIGKAPFAVSPLNCTAKYRI